MDKNPNFLPAIIIVAGLVIGLAIYSVRASHVLPTTGDVAALRPVSTADHIAGNPEAPVVVVEYSDIDCEYCKQFQESMEQIMTDYAPKGSVAWVYRHFPLVAVHPNSAMHAEAAECVASLGSPDLFFRFIDALQQAAPSAAQFDPKGYGPIIASLGIPADQFQSCVDSNKFEKRVTDDYNNAIASGAAGAAPFSVILIKGHDPVPVSGSLPYTALKKVIDAAIQKSTEPAKN